MSEDLFSVENMLSPEDQKAWDDFNDNLPVFRDYEHWIAWASENNDKTMAFFRTLVHLRKKLVDMARVDPLMAFEPAWHILTEKTDELANRVADAFDTLQVPFPEDLEIEMFGRVMSEEDWQAIGLPGGPRR